MTSRDCNACSWTGDEAECVWCGAVGPLCPMCHETTDIASPPVSRCSAAHGCALSGECGRHAAYTAHPTAPHIDASAATVPGTPCPLFDPIPTPTARSNA